MTTFDDREKAEEARFAHNEELAFKARARRDRHVGLWAAEKLGLSGGAADDYAAALLQANLREATDEKLVTRLVADLAPKGIGEHTIRHELAEQLVAATQALRQG